MDKLPTEIVELILNHLNDLKDLINLTKVFPILRLTILNSPKLSKKFVLHLQGEQWKQKSKLIYQDGVYLNSLEMKDVKFKDEKELFGVFKNAPNLKKLKLEFCDVIDLESETQNQNKAEQYRQNAPSNTKKRNCNITATSTWRVIQHQLFFKKNLRRAGFIYLSAIIKKNTLTMQLKNLNEITLDHCYSINCYLLKALKNTKGLKKCEIVRPDLDFTDVIIQQDHLEELALEHIYTKWKLFEADNQNNIQFKLKKLSLKHIFLDDVEAVVMFVKAQTEFLKELSVPLNILNTQSVSLLNEGFVNLQIISFTGPMEDYGIIDSLRDARMQKIREVSFVKNKLNRDGFDAIISVFPNIEHLFYEGMVDFGMEDILKKFKKLSSISVANFPVEALENVKIINLSKLNITKCINTTSWLNFFINNPKIELFTINECDNFITLDEVKNEINSIIKSLKLLTNLKKFEVAFKMIPLYPDDMRDINQEQSRRLLFSLKIDAKSKSIKCNENFKQYFNFELKALMNTFEGFLFEIIE